MTPALLADARLFDWHGLEVPEPALEVAQATPSDSIASYEQVSLADVLHHLPKGGQGAFVAELAERLPSGGRFVLADIDASALVRRFCNQLHDLVLARQWVHPVTPAAARALVEAAGLTVRSEETVNSLWYRHYLTVAEKP